MTHGKGMWAILLVVLVLAGFGVVFIPSRLQATATPLNVTGEITIAYANGEKKVITPQSTNTKLAIADVSNNNLLIDSISFTPWIILTYEGTAKTWSATADMTVDIANGDDGTIVRRGFATQTFSLPTGESSNPPLSGQRKTFIGWSLTVPSSTIEQSLGTVTGTYLIQAKITGRVTLTDSSGNSVSYTTPSPGTLTYKVIYTKSGSGSLSITGLSFEITPSVSRTEWWYS